MASSSDLSPRSLASSDASLLWEMVPLEICQRVIFPFLDAKSLSTFHLAILADYNSKEAQDCELALRRFGSDQLTSLCRSWDHAISQAQGDYDNTVLVEKDDSDNFEAMTDDNAGVHETEIYLMMEYRLQKVRGFVQRAVNFLEPLQQQQPQQPQQQQITAGCNNSFSSKSKQFSETMILWQALKWAHTDWHNNEDNKNQPTVAIPATMHVNRLVEAPIWCGQIQVLVWVQRGHYHGFSRVLLRANVALLSPLWNQQSHLEAWESLGRTSTNDNDDNNSSPPLPTVTMIVETYNFRPTAPIGRLVGLQRADRETLQNIALRLRDQNTVAILSPQQQRRPFRYIRQVMIVSRSQARQRATRPILPFCYYSRDIGNHLVQEEELREDDLVCCWQCTDAVDDITNSTSDNLIRHWKRILVTREKVLATGETINTPQ